MQSLTNEYIDLVRIQITPFNEKFLKVEYKIVHLGIGLMERNLYSN